MNVIDDYNREALAIEVDFSMSGERVKQILNEVIYSRRKPKKIRVDNGPEFISKALKNWAQKNEIELKYIQPGSPTQNAYIERFNRLFREDILAAYLYRELHQVSCSTALDRTILLTEYAFRILVSKKRNVYFWVFL
ncbi:putative transposase [Thermophagus xiamenensis]|uniref:Putative transposase n=1 Tax=Thermophagus xiamenensis TaxID=385682 RepID=A0A1I2DU35_9BACT|nr:DDE-type integrase/transposase/recombinase [Thermophagus xiamenensis]SFE83440.1 putative transposase [Thermophagus xiamenensis]